MVQFIENNEKKSFDGNNDAEKFYTAMQIEKIFTDERNVRCSY